MQPETACTLTTLLAFIFTDVVIDFHIEIFFSLASTNFDQLFDEMFHLCRLDQNYVIKVADFGLSENTYAKSYFRQQQTAGVKLPIKWMAYESLTDGIFSEKTDVVSSVLNTSYRKWLLQINVEFGLI